MLKQQVIEEFIPITKTFYEQASTFQPVTDIYIFKKNFPNVVVKAHQPKNKIHCWRLYHIEFMEIKPLEGEQNARTKLRQSQIIEFQGQLIFSLIQKFQTALNAQFRTQLGNENQLVRKWCDEPLKQIYIVDQKVQQKFSFLQGFIDIKSFINEHEPHHFFEWRRWRGQPNSHLIDIEKQETIASEFTDYSTLLDRVFETKKGYKFQIKTEDTLKLY